MNLRSLVFGIPILLLVSALFVVASQIQTVKISSLTGLVSVGCASGYDYCKIGEYYTLSVKSDPTSNDPLRLTKDGLYLTLRPSEIFYADLNNEQIISDIQSVQGSLKNYSNITNNVIHYPNAFGDGISLEYRWTQNRLLKFLIINNFSDLPKLNISMLNVTNVNLVFRETFTFSPNLDVYIDGKKWDKNKRETTDKKIELKRGNETIMILPSPYMKDADDNYKRISYILKKKDGKLKIAVTVPYNWLYQAKYPIMIDPTVQTNVGGTGVTAQNNQRKIVRDSTGVGIHVTYENLNTGMAEYSNSTDNGVTFNGNDVINPNCVSAAIDITTSDDLVVVCAIDDTYITSPPVYFPFISTTGGVPFISDAWPDLDIGAFSDIGVIAEQDIFVTGFLQYWEAPFPYGAWLSWLPFGGVPAESGSIDIAIDYTESYVCIGYNNLIGMSHDVTCCNIGVVNCLAGGWSPPMALGGVNAGGGSCAFDSGGIFHCAYVWDDNVRINWYDPVGAGTGTETILDPQPKMICGEPSLSVDSATEMYVSMMCDDGRGGAHDIFVANRSGAKHWGYPQKESTWIIDIDEDLAFPASPANFNIVNPDFEWIYTLDNFSFGTYDVEYDSAINSAPTVSYCNGNYTGKDWVIDATHDVYCENETIWFDNASDLNISGNLTFKNVTLKMSSFEDGDDRIFVLNGGIFNITDTYGSSKIEYGYCPNCYYTVEIQNGGLLQMNNSEMFGVYTLTISAGGVLNISDSTNISFHDDANCGFGTIAGTVDMQGTATNKVNISMYGASPTNDWDVIQANAQSWYARFTIFDNWKGAGALGGKIVWDNVNVTNQNSMVFFNNVDTGTSFTNSEMDGLWYVYTISATIIATFDNITFTDGYPLLRSVLNKTFNNIHTNSSTNDGLVLNQLAINVTFNNFTSDSRIRTGSLISDIDFTCNNCRIDHANGIVTAFEDIFYVRMNFNNSNFTTVTDWHQTQTPNSYIVSRNHNGTANSYYGWFNQTNFSDIYDTMGMQSFGFTSTDDVLINKGTLLGNSPDISCENLTIDANGVYNATVSTTTIYQDLNVTGSLNIFGTSNMTGNIAFFTGEIKIHNGSMYNFTYLDMNNTKAHIGNATNVTLHSWTTLPAIVGVDVNLTGRAINISNFSTGGYTNLTIYYNDSDIVGLDESALKIWKYTGVTWINISSTVNEIGNYVTANDVTAFSVFVVGAGIVITPPYIPSIAVNKTLDDVWCAILGFADCGSVPFFDFRMKLIIGITWDKFIFNNLWWLTPLGIGLIILVVLYIRGKRRAYIYEEE